MNNVIRATAFAAGVLAASSAFACPDGYDCGTVVSRASGDSCFHFGIKTNEFDDSELVREYGIPYDVLNKTESVVGRIAAVPPKHDTISLKPGNKIFNCQGFSTTPEAFAPHTPALP